MPEWLQSALPAGWTPWHIAIAGVVFATASALLSVVVIGYILSRLPADYFVNPTARVTKPRNLVTHVLFALTRNLFGVMLIVLGIVLSLPGVPGQGILTILMGVMLVDFPGKYAVERWLLTRRGVLSGVNALRAKMGQPPLLAELPATP